jgi:hypothetical protein
LSRIILFKIKFVSDLRQIGGLLQVYSGFLLHKNWPPWYNWNIVESGVKHHNPLTLFPIVLYILLRLSSSDYLFGSSNFSDTKWWQKHAIKLIKSSSSWRNFLFEDGSKVFLIIILRYVENNYMNWGYGYGYGVSRNFQKFFIYIASHWQTLSHNVWIE